MVADRAQAYEAARRAVDSYVPAFATKPFAHQLVGAARLVAHQTFALFDEMGVAKSKQVIDAACILLSDNVVDAVVVAAPAKVRRLVWADPENGELAKHGWGLDMIRTLNYDGTVGRQIEQDDRANWLTVSYELLRNEQHLAHVGRWMQRRKRVWLVLDESHSLKNRTALQSRAVAKLRALCERCTLLTGTPVANNPLDLWAPMRILDQASLPFKNFYAFRARYAVMGGFMNKQPIKWINQDELQGLLAPYVLRREKRDCLDLPPKLYEAREVPLSAESWRIYRELREEAIAALNAGGDQVITLNAGVKLMRLAQITNGFIGGLTAEDGQPVASRELGTEKLTELNELLEAWNDRRVVVWCRFRYQIAQAASALRLKRPTFKLWGGLTDNQLNEQLTGFQKAEDAVLLAQPQAGGQGINNLAISSSVIYLSNDYNLLTRQQSEDRCHRPGQFNPVTYVDVLAAGPRGQKTIDHVIVRALRKKENLAAMTTNCWRMELLDE